MVKNLFVGSKSSLKNTNKYSTCIYGDEPQLRIKDQGVIIFRIFRWRLKTLSYTFVRKSNGLYCCYNQNSTIKNKCWVYPDESSFFSISRVILSNSTTKNNFGIAILGLIIEDALHKKILQNYKRDKLLVLIIDEKIE